DHSLAPEDQAELRCRLADAFETAGLFDEGLNLLQPYEDPSALAGLSSETIALVRLAQASLYRWHREIPRSITYANNSLRTATSDLSHGRAHNLLGYVYWMIDEYAIARDHLNQAIEYIQRSGDRRELA